MTIMFKRVTLVLALILVVSATVGAFALADGEGGGYGEPGPPGTLMVGEDETQFDLLAITTDGTTYDPTILTKYIPARAFIANQGAGVDADLVEFDGQTCVSPNSASGGSLTGLFAPVELPDGARIGAVVFFGQDDATENISVQLFRREVTFPSGGGVPSRSELAVSNFSTATFSGVMAVGEIISEVTGSSVSGSNFLERFYTARIILENAAGSNHVLCGVEVWYQVPVTSVDAGTSFYPINPIRAYDSRQPAYPINGVLSPNSNRVISIMDGHDNVGTVIVPNAVPVGATAIAYNLTIAEPTGSNWVSVTAGDATSGIGTSFLNYTAASSELANAGIVPIDASRRIALWGGTSPGSTHVIVDITGYYMPIVYPNMGN